MADNGPIDKEVAIGQETREKKRQILAQLRGLADDPVWAYIKSVLRSQADKRFYAIGMSAPKEICDFLNQERVRGEAEALQVLASLPGFLIAMFEADLGEEAEEAEHDLG